MWVDDELDWQSPADVFTRSTLTCSPLELATGVSGTWEAGGDALHKFAALQISAPNAESEIYSPPDVNN